MSTSTRTGDAVPRATEVTVTREWLRVVLRDGRELAVPIAWYPWLADVSDVALADVEIIEDGQGIWWTSIDEGLSVPGLFGLPHA
jgi:hypothetical protein